MTVQSSACLVMSRTELICGEGSLIMNELADIPLIASFAELDGVNFMPISGKSDTCGLSFVTVPEGARYIVPKSKTSTAFPC